MRALVIVGVTFYAPSLHAQTCAPNVITGTISSADGSSTPTQAGVVGIPCTSCPQAFAPVPGSASVRITPSPNVQFIYPHSQYFNPGPVNGATCTYVFPCWQCSGSFSFNLTSRDGALDGFVYRLPSFTPFAGAHVFAIRELGWLQNQKSTDSSGYYAFQDASPNNWGLRLNPTPGPANYLVVLSGWPAARGVPTTISSNQLSKVDLVVRDPGFEEPPRCGSCQTPPTGPSPSATSSSSGGVDTTPPGPACTVGKPVSVTTGNVDLDQTDARIPGLGLGLRFSRSYNSQNIAPGRYGIFGRGWTHAYEKRLTFAATGVILLRDGQGQPAYYQDNDSDGEYLASAPFTEESWIDRQSSTLYVRQFRRGGSEVYEIPSGSTTANLTALTDASGNTTVLGYTSGKLTTISDPGGRQLTLTYVGTQVTGLGGPDGPIATFTYTTVSGGGPILGTVTYADGDGNGSNDGSYTFAYHSTGRLHTVTDGAGKTLETHIYDGTGRAIETSISGPVERYTLDYSQTRQTKVTDANGALTTYEWVDLWGAKRVSKITGPCSGCGGSGNQTQEWTYDNRGRVTAHKDGEGNVTHWEYDPDGNVIQVSTPPPAPGGTTLNTQYTYDSNGRVATQTSPNGAITTWTYVAAGPHTITQDVSTGVTRTTTIDYLPNGKVQYVRDPLNRETELHYNAFGDLDWTEDPLGHRTSFQYDAMGRREKTIPPATTPAIDTPTTSYDTLGRVSRVTNPNNSFWQNTYDGGGRRIAALDPLGHQTSYAYDAYGRLSTVTDDIGGVTEYRYDVQSNLRFLIDPKQHPQPDPPTTATEFRYEDGHNRVTKVVYPGNLAEEFTYDLAGHLATRTDRKGVETTFTYDALGRLTGKTYSNGSSPVTFEYDGGDDTGFLTGASNSADTLGWDYDRAGQMLSESSTRNATAISYQYFLSGERQKVRLNGNDVLTYAYELDGQLNTLTRTTGVVFDFVADPAHRRQAVQFPNATTTEYSYDPLSRLSLVRLKRGATVLNDITYESNDLNNRTSRTENGTRLEYGYDDISRLLEVNRTLPTTGLLEQYTYDPVGNRGTALGVPGPWSYNERNELTSYNGINFTYDLNGNQLTRSGTPSRTNTWDVENRLTAVVDGGVTKAQFEYDPLGRRVAKNVPGVGLTRFAYDGEDILFEQGPSGNFTYLHGPGIDEPLARESSTGVRTYYHADGLGSIVKRTDAAGSVVATQAYDSFGVGAGLAGGYSYTGRERDEETALYFYRARHYEPTLGRFLSSDPIGFDGGLNFYAYVLANPTNWTDPFGLDVNVCLYSDAAYGFGHVGFGLPGEPGTTGYYADGIREDNQQDESCKVVPASPDQDQCMLECRNERQQNPGEYKLFKRQCTSFVRDCLRQCGLEGGGYNGPRPFPFFEGLPFEESN